MIDYKCIHLLTVIYNSKTVILKSCLQIPFFNCQIFKNGELEYNEDEEEGEEDDKIEYKQEKVERPKQFGQGFALPGFPAGGFKLKPTGRSLLDNSPSEPESSTQQGDKTDFEFTTT